MPDSLRVAMISLKSWRLLILFALVATAVIFSQLDTYATNKLEPKVPKTVKTVTTKAAKTTTVMTNEADTATPTKQSPLKLTNEQKIKSILEEKIPGIVITHIIKAPEFGAAMYHVLTDDFTSIYVNADVRNFIIGEHYTFDNKGKVRNLSQQHRVREQFAKVKQIPLDQMIIFPATDNRGNEIKSDKWVIIFTDIDCGYCRKFHTEIDEVNRLGIEVRYMFFPRTGINSDAYNKAVSVWCADDKQASMTAAKAGLPIKAKECSNPVEEQYKLGRQTGVKGTPTMWTSNGILIPGYIKPQQLLSAIQS